MFINIVVFITKISKKIFFDNNWFQNETNFILGKKPLEAYFSGKTGLLLETFRNKGNFQRFQCLGLLGLGWLLGT